MTAAELAAVSGEANWPRSISRLWPKPGTRSTPKPTACRLRRTKPAAVKVAKLAHGLLRRAMAANSASLHIAGFLAGAKPSRNQQST